MSIQTITPDLAEKLISEGATVVDIRSAGEFSGEHILGAKNVPMEQITINSFGGDDNKKVVFYCRSGMRTKMNTQQLESSVKGEAFIIDGGLSAWKKQGLSVNIGAKQPLEIFRQVQIIAGILIMLGVLLGYTFSVWFYALSFLVGAGLLFAGVTGFCGMAVVLMKMPWNKTNSAA